MRFQLLYKTKTRIGPFFIGRSAPGTCRGGLERSGWVSFRLPTRRSPRSAGRSRWVSFHCRVGQTWLAASTEVWPGRQAVAWTWVATCTLDESP